VDENSGILPRLAFFIFEEIKRLHVIGELDIEVSALEVYCGNDLLPGGNENVRLLANS
jgi:hypothetical protein